MAEAPNCGPRGNGDPIDPERVVIGWSRFLEGLPPGEGIRPVIFESWQRSLASGVDPTPEGLPLHRVPEEELHGRLARNEQWVSRTTRHIDWLSMALGDTPHVVYVVDGDGIVLHSTGNLPAMAELGLLPGYDWSETRMGTNGAGTAVRSGRPVAIVGPEHFSRPFQDCTCTAAPIRLPDGRIAGALDITTRAADGKPERVVLAAYVAKVIEEELRQIESEAAQHARAETAQKRVLEILSGMTDGFYGLDRDWRFTALSPVAENYLGRTEAELIGEVVWEVFPQAVGSIFEEQYRRALEENGPAHFEALSPLTKRWIEVHAYPSEKGLSVFFRDITARKEAEHALEKLNRTLEERVHRQTGLLRLLHDVTSVANLAHTVEDALRMALERICRHKGWPLGRAFLRSNDGLEALIPLAVWYGSSSRDLGELDETVLRKPPRHGSSLIGRVLATGRADWATEVESELAIRHAWIGSLGIRTVVAFPMSIESEVVGVVECFTREALAPEPSFLDGMENIGIQLGRVVERQRAEAQLIQALWLQERRLGQELHDTVLQDLTGLGLTARTVERRLAARRIPEAEVLGRVARELQSATGRVREFARGLFPVEIDVRGLSSALTDLLARTEERHGIVCRLHCQGELEIADNNLATHLFRMAQEVTANAVKHGRPGRIDVVLERSEQELRLEVRDDGPGFVPDESGSGMGLRILRHRASLIGASIGFEKGGSGGLRFRCLVRGRRG